MAASSITNKFVINFKFLPLNTFNMLLNIVLCFGVKTLQVTIIFHVFQLTHGLCKVHFDWMQPIIAATNRNSYLVDHKFWLHHPKVETSELVYNPCWLSKMICTVQDILFNNLKKYFVVNTIFYTVNIELTEIEQTRIPS